MTDDRLLTPEKRTAIRKDTELSGYIGDLGAIDFAERVALKIAKAQLAHTLQRFKDAIEQSSDEIELSEEEYEVFSSIQNDAIAKEEDRHQKQIEAIFKEMGKVRATQLARDKARHQKEIEEIFKGIDDLHLFKDCPRWQDFKSRYIKGEK